MGEISLCAPNPTYDLCQNENCCKLVVKLDDLQQAVASYTSRAAEKLRRQHSVTGALQVFLKTNPRRLHHCSQGASTHRNRKLAMAR